MKQYLEDPSISIYGSDEFGNYIFFFYTFLTLSHQVSEIIKETSKTDSFLKKEYKSDFNSYFYHSFTKLIEINDKNLEEYTKYGFKSVYLEIFERLRFVFLKFFKDIYIYLFNRNASALLNDNNFMYLDVTIKRFFRPWYLKLVELIDSYFYSYVDIRINSFLLLFIFMLIFISIFYWIIWKRNEEEFINKIEKSFDLINLISEEIKTIIVNKLNEAN